MNGIGTGIVCGTTMTYHIILWVAIRAQIVWCAAVPGITIVPAVVPLIGRTKAPSAGDLPSDSVWFGVQIDDSAVSRKNRNSNSRI